MRQRYGCALPLVLVGAGVLAAMLLTAAPAIPAKKRALLKGFGGNPRIENLKIIGRGDDLPFPFGETYRADAAEFRIKGCPDARVIVAGPDPDIFAGTDHLYLGSIGPYNLSEVCYHSNGVTTTGAVDIGPGGHGPVPPFRVASVDDLIDHYDDLLAYLSDQPPTQTFRSRSDGEEWTREIAHRRGGTGRGSNRSTTILPSTRPAEAGRAQP